MSLDTNTFQQTVFSYLQCKILQNTDWHVYIVTLRSVLRLLRSSWKQSIQTACADQSIRDFDSEKKILSVEAFGKLFQKQATIHRKPQNWNSTDFTLKEFRFWGKKKLSPQILSSSAQAWKLMSQSLTGYFPIKTSRRWGSHSVTKQRDYELNRNHRQKQAVMSMGFNVLRTDTLSNVWK